MRLRRRLMHRLTRIHLWIGEVAELTHYRNCHLCKHCHAYENYGPEVIGCDIYRKDDDVPNDDLAVTDPSEAVWCYDFEENASA